MKLLNLCLISTLLSFIGNISLAQDVIKSHGISTFGDLKYGYEFENLSYVNVKIHSQSPTWVSLGSII